MKRVIAHWSVARGRALRISKKHYHFIVEDDGNIVEGIHPVSANLRPRRGKYAAHTRACNTGSIGIACSAMYGATGVNNVGNYPITDVQFEAMCKKIAELCKEYNIKVTRKTVLSHAEVERELGKRQRGKWDISVLPHVGLKGSRTCGDYMRERVRAYMRNKKLVAVAEDAAKPSTTKAVSLFGSASGLMTQANELAYATSDWPIAKIFEYIAEVPSWVWVLLAVGSFAYVWKERHRKQKDSKHALGD